MDPRRTEDELEQMRANAIEKQNFEFARLAEDQLNRRFPGWKRIKRKPVRSKLTLARFKGDEHEFPASKDAYIWLLEKFIGVKPDLFLSPTFETDFIAVGHAQDYFGRDPQSMFHKSPHLAEDHNKYHQLTNGWYANLVLSNERKLDILCRFAAVAKLDWQLDWYWDVLQ